MHYLHSIETTTTETGLCLTAVVLLLAAASWWFLQVREAQRWSDRVAALAKAREGVAAVPARCGPLNAKPAARRGISARGRGAGKGRGRGARVVDGPPPTAAGQQDPRVWEPPGSEGRGLIGG